MKNKSVQGSLYRERTCLETACVVRGELSIDLLRLAHNQPISSSPDNTSNETHVLLNSTGLQLVPEVQRRIWDLTKPLDDQNMKDMSSDVFPVAVEDLALGSRVAELGLEGMTLLYCKLELDVKDLRSDVGMMSSKADSDWFAWKLKRATEYRMRGNAAFKQESYRFALQLYKRSLAWLEPPSTQSDATLDMDVQYSTEELQQVNPVAVACYANMATCYSKLDNSVKNCIDAASNALAFDDTHLKARYRRSQAYMSSKEYDLALADLNKLCELEPANKLFQSAYTQAKTAKLQLRQKQQNAYANLFHK